MHKGEILELINDKLSNSQVNIFCTSAGGGSGAGSSEIIIELLAELGKPLVVIAALPMANEDPHTKQNSLETLSTLTNFIKSKKVSNLILIDNAKLEAIYHNVNQMDFYEVSNNAIVQTLDAFNSYSAMASSVKSLDPMEFSKLLIDSEGLTTFGELTVANYEEDTAIAEAIVNSLSNNLLASNFNLTQSKYVGFLMVANKEVWSKIPSSSINYASSMIADVSGNPKGIFKGVYVSESPENVVKVYSIFSGLGLPAARVEELKKETTELQNKIKGKDDQRNLSIQLNNSVNETATAAQKIKEKIASKSSTFGKFVPGGTSDRRK